MKTNNVNYNSNPAFGTKLNLTGSRELAENIANALRGGCVSQGRENLITIIPLAKEYLVVMGKTDSDAFERFCSNKDKGGGIPLSELKQFFVDEDKLDLSKPLRFVVEGAQASVKRFVSALKGGLLAQEIPQGIAHNSKKTFIAIDDEAKLLANMQKKLLANMQEDYLGVLVTNGWRTNKLVEDFFKNAQVIHVTK